jgi:hypothetical protein
MNSNECKYCNKKFTTKSNLNYHQKNTKYCLEIQGNKSTQIIKCSFCQKELSSKKVLNIHKIGCTNFLIYEKTKYIQNRMSIMEEEGKKKDILISELRQNVTNLLRDQLEKTQERYDKLSLSAVKRPTNTNTKNIQINNYIQQMAPLTIQDIKESVPHLTLEHHVKGAEGYAEYALEFPFKDKIVCVDVSRNKIKYKNSEGDVIEDIGFRKMMVKLCESLKDRTFNLCQEHYEKLSAKFTEKEMNEYNCMDTALAITRYASGRESEFCNKVIKLISKKSKR